MRKALFSTPVLAGVALALTASTASAAHPQIKIREFYPGGATNDSYVVLQAYAPNQNLLAGHKLTWVTAPPTGGGGEYSFTLPNNVTNTASQSTVLIADSGYTGSPTPDFTVPGLALYPTSGSLCFDPETDAEFHFTASDCVAWGGGGGTGDAGPEWGYPAFQLRGVPAGKAGRRQIGNGCPTLLENRDDFNQGNNDFTTAPPTPRNNASPIEETPCNPPHTGINSATATDGETTSETSVRIAFAASPFPEATYECKLDGGAFAACVSPVEYTGLNGDQTADGTPHQFEVRASNSNGLEQTPASLNWTVDTTPSLLSAPADEHPGAGTSGATTSAAAATSAPSAALASAVQGTAARQATPKAKAKHKKHHAKHVHHPGR